MAGDDTLDGGHDADILYGGSGADVFRFDFGGGQEAPGDDLVRDFDLGIGAIDSVDALLSEIGSSSVEVV